MNRIGNTRHRKILIYLVLLDIMGAFAAFSAAHAVTISSGFILYRLDVAFGDYLYLCILSIVVFILIFYGVGLYDRRNLFWGAEEYNRAIRGCSYYTLSIIFVSFFIREPFASRGWLITNWALSIITVCGGRAFFRQYMRRLVKGGQLLLDRALILGASERSVEIARRLEQTGMIKVIGFLDDYSPPGTEVLPGKRILGTARLYRQIASKEDVNLAILVPDAVSWEARRAILRPSLDNPEPELQVASEGGDLSFMTMRVSFRGGVPLLRFQLGYTKGIGAVFKLVLDYVLSAVLLAITAPVMLIIGLVLLGQGRWPVIKKFKIWGKGGKVIETYKFHTGLATPTAHRSFRQRVQPDIVVEPMNPVERFLLRTGLDKLPQLLNVLMGNMSLVGPRTISIEHPGNNDPWLPVVLAVKPGIIGNWALREARDQDQEIAVTLYYVRNWSVWLDIAILGQTAWEIVRTRFRSRIKESISEQVYQKPSSA